MTSSPDAPRVTRYSVFKRLGAARSGKIPIVLQLTPTDCGAARLGYPGRGGSR